MERAPGVQPHRTPLRTSTRPSRAGHGYRVRSRRTPRPSAAGGADHESRHSARAPVGPSDEAEQSATCSYAASGVAGSMPLPGLCRCDGQEGAIMLESGLLERGTGPRWIGIVLPSQTCQERRELTAGPIASGLAVVRSDFGEDLLFEFQIGIQVNLGSLHRLMSHPQSNVERVGSCLQ